MEVTN